MAKTEKDIEEGRELRNTLKKYYGFPLTSVWNIDYGKNALMWDPRERKAETNKRKLDKRGLTALNEKLGDAFGMTYRSCRGKDGAKSHSIMPYDLAERCVKFYSNKGDTYLSPCMGDMAWMTVCYHLGLNFIGYDVSEKNFGINVELKKRLLGKGDQKILISNNVKIDLYNHSSEKMPEVKDNSVDIIAFSPPYWDIEFYGDEDEQLGYNKTYLQFLAGMKRLISECFRVLKPGKFCIININDFRKNGVFYDYHIDIVNIMNDLGFIRWDTIIVNWPSCIGQAFITRLENNKMMAKKHEYVIVGRKPGFVLDEKISEDIIENNTDFTDDEITEIIDEYDGLIDEKKAINILEERKNGK